MEVKVLEVIGLRHDLGTARRAVDPRIASAWIEVPVVVIDERRDIAPGVLFEHLRPHLKIGLDVLLRGVLIEAVFDGIRFVGVVATAQVLVLKHAIDHSALLIGHQAVAGSFLDRAIVFDLGVNARIKTVVLLDEACRLLKRNREDLALGARRDIVRRHKYLGEIHVGDKAERKHCEHADPTEARRGVRGRDARLFGHATGHMRVPGAKRRRNHAGR